MIPLLIGFHGTQITPFVRSALAQGCPGVILFSRNIESPARLRTLTDQLREAGAAIVAVDQEGGRVARLRDGFTPAVPSMRSIGSSEPDARQLATLAGTALAAHCIQAGANLNFAPVVDVDSNPRNPVIADRSFSHDPSTVAPLATAIIQAMQTAGVAACAKHFPGHGDTHTDSHLQLPTLMHDRARLDRIELPPFHAAIQARVAAIMTAHILFPAIDPHTPATLSPHILQPILRHSLSYDGLIVSDCLEMAAIADLYHLPDAAEQAWLAGVDLLLVSHREDRQAAVIQRARQLAASSPAARTRLAEAAQRIARLASRFPAQPASSAPAVDPAAFARLADRAAEQPDPTAPSLRLPSAHGG